jgi:hypothetical protein
MVPQLGKCSSVGSFSWHAYTDLPASGHCWTPRAPCFTIAARETDDSTPTYGNGLHGVARISLCDRTVRRVSGVDTSKAINPEALQYEWTRASQL